MQYFTPFLFDLQESVENLLKQGAEELQQQEFLSSGSETVNLTAVAIQKSRPSPLNSDPSSHS